MPLTEVDEAEFDRLARLEGLTLVDFRADWCGPCHRFDTELAKVASRHPNVTFVAIDVEREVHLAASARIQSLPTIILMRDGWLLHRSSGLKTANELDKLIDKAESSELPDSVVTPGVGQQLIGRLTGRQRPIRLVPPPASGA